LLAVRCLLVIAIVNAGGGGVPGGAGAGGGAPGNASGPTWSRNPRCVIAAVTQVAGAPTRLESVIDRVMVAPSNVFVRLCAARTILSVGGITVPDTALSPGIDGDSWNEATCAWKSAHWDAPV
jgi:hypothetical protein